MLRRFYNAARQNGNGPFGRRKTETERVATPTATRRAQLRPRYIAFDMFSILVLTTTSVLFRRRLAMRKSRKRANCRKRTVNTCVISVRYARSRDRLMTVFLRFWIRRNGRTSVSDGDRRGRRRRRGGDRFRWQFGAARNCTNIVDACVFFSIWFLDFC
jgi:hypothetical protein